jgi:imidazolonepropionase-like amidohydrolase
MKKYFYWIALIFIFLGFRPVVPFDLIIIHANILDVKTGKILIDKSILIKDGIIKDITSSNRLFSSGHIINAKGKLVTPSFIDTHIHPADTFGDYASSPQFLKQDSLSFYRQKLSNTYLPYGVTTIFSMGHRESWIAPLLMWQNNPSATYTDLFTCGAAIATTGNYVGHVFVKGDSAAKAKVIEYNNLGMHYIKLYARTSPEEFKTAIKTAQRLKLKIFGHIGDFDFKPEYISMQEAMDLGLKNFEHIATIPNAVMTRDDWTLYRQQCLAYYGEKNSETKAIVWILEQFRYVYIYKQSEMNKLIDMLAKHNVTFSTTIHIFFKQFDPAYVSKKSTTLTQAQISRCKENFKIMMKYALQIHNKGIPLRIGTDTQNGGEALLSEMVLMCKNGFSPKQVFKIATYNGAKCMGLDNIIGSIEKGKHANMLVWNTNPLNDYTAIKRRKTIIKDGIIY